VSPVAVRLADGDEAPRELDVLLAERHRALVGLALTSLHPQPLTPTLWLELGIMGVFCAAGTLSFYFAVKHTSASNVSQYHYTQLPTGALISYLVWHERPGLSMVLGGSLIIGSGLWIALEAHNAQSVPRAGVASG